MNTIDLFFFYLWHELRSGIKFLPLQEALNLYVRDWPPSSLIELWREDLSWSGMLLVMMYTDNDFVYVVVVVDDDDDDYDDVNDIWW